MTTIAPEDPQRKLRLLFGAIVVLFVILVLRLFYLQITTFSDYARASEYNYIAQQRIKAPRGLIYARGGEVLARNRAFYTIAIERSNRQEYTAIIGALQNALGDAQIGGPYRGGQRIIRLKRDVEFRTVAIVEESLKSRWPKLSIEIEGQRYYPYGSTAAHLLGHMGIIQEEDAALRSSKSYMPGDFVGRTGLERVFEESLRGYDGVRFVEVDADGRRRREFPDRQQAAQHGQDLHLTIDLAVQQAAEYAFPDSLSGSVVAIDPQTGAVLAMVSKPTFDPNIFVSFQAQDERRRILQGETTLLNRTIRGRYPPGSTLKMVAAAAALEERVTDTLSTLAPCAGSLRMGDVVFRCLNNKAHGALTLQEAMEVSCNIYFLNLAQFLGFDSWRRYADKFGFGQPTGLILEPSEAAGLLPSRAYYQQTEGGWSLGHLMNLVIGQGAILVTPLQMARYVAAIGNGGYLVTPHVYGLPPPRQRISGLSANTLESVKSAMHRVVHGQHGTGHRVRLTDVEVAGKSGTAQSPRHSDDAWFVAFAPYDRPTIAVAVVVESGGSGGGVAAPIVHQIIAAFFANEAKEQAASASRTALAPSSLR